MNHDSITRRHALRLAAATSSSAALAACGRGTPPGSDTSPGAAPAAQIKRGAKIVWAVDDGPTRTPLRADQTKLFNKQFPDVDVESITGATDTEKLQALFAAGTPPDLFRQETAGMAFFASRDQAASLDPLLKRDKYDLSDFFPNAWELWKWKGQHYGLPFLGIRIVYFNRALTEQVGTRVPTTWKDASWTWDTFLEACKKATVTQGSSAARWGAAELPLTRRDWQPWIWANDGDLFGADVETALDEIAKICWYRLRDTVLWVGVE